MNGLSFLEGCLYHCIYKIPIHYQLMGLQFEYHRVHPRVTDRGILTRYGAYRGNKIPRANQNQYRCLAVDRGICKG
jgi:hypothetical protein